MNATWVMDTHSDQFVPTGRKAREQLELALWLSLPSYAREPRTQKQLAKKLGVDASTFSDWKLLPGFMIYVRHLMEERIQEDCPDVVGALVRKAKKGDVPALKLFFDYFIY